MPTPSPTSTPDPQPDPQSQDTAASLGPYQDDLEYLQGEMRWVGCRCRRLYLARGLRAVDGPPEDRGYQPIKAEPEVIRARHGELVEQEQRIRAEIDARLAATWTAGVSLGLDQIQEAHHLDAFERAVLLLAATPVLNPDIEDVWSGACRTAHLNVGSVYALLEMGARERVGHHGYFGEDRVLVGAGLIELVNCCPDPCPEELAETTVRLTAKGFRLMLGIQEADAVKGSIGEPEAVEPEGQAPRCGRRLCRERDDHEVEGAAIAIPEIRLSDVVVDSDLSHQLEEIVAAARGRNEVLRRWGLGHHIPYGRGVAALFYGPPGVGKTHAALAIAGELGNPIIEATYPDLVSKWMGESAKNLASLFNTAAQEDAVLLIDEADSLLGQRGQGASHPHDDALVNVLLKELEHHDGVVVLVTNLREMLDGALGRRLSYQLHFREPGAAERCRIWELMIPDTVPTEGVLDFASLGQRYVMTGGLIKNAVLKACFRAARAGVPISMSLLAAAAAEEVAAQAGDTGTRSRVAGFSRA